jgi:hypothetical protein
MLLLEIAIAFTSQVLYVRRDETFCMEEGGQQDGVEEQF